MKFSEFSIAAAALLVVITAPAFAQESATLADRPFLEVWSDNAYHSTNFGADESEYREEDYVEPAYREEDFLLTQLSLLAGMRWPLTDTLFVDAGFTLELVADWGDEEWNDAYWNNMVVWGPSARLSYEAILAEEGEQAVWVSDFNATMFMDYLFSEDGPDRGKERIPDRDASENFRTGATIWAALDSRELFEGRMSFWAEVWAELAYESTSFAEDPAEDFYPLTLDLLAGPQFPLGEIAIQTYLSLTLSRDLGDESWNREPWLNNWTYGPGLRLSMGSLLPVTEADLYLYAEYLEVSYLDRVDRTLYENTADEDFRAGIEFYLPFGATKERIKRH